MTVLFTTEDHSQHKTDCINCEQCSSVTSVNQVIIRGSTAEHMSGLDPVYPIANGQVHSVYFLCEDHVNMCGALRGAVDVDPS